MASLNTNDARVNSVSNNRGQPQDLGIDITRRDSWYTRWDAGRPASNIAFILDAVNGVAPARIGERRHVVEKLTFVIVTVSWELSLVFKGEPFGALCIHQIEQIVCCDVL
jgi:hypothetical protein